MTTDKTTPQVPEPWMHDAARAILSDYSSLSSESRINTCASIIAKHAPTPPPASAEVRAMLETVTGLIERASRHVSYKVVTPDVLNKPVDECRLVLLCEEAVVQSKAMLVALSHGQAQARLSTQLLGAIAKVMVNHETTYGQIPNFSMLQYALKDALATNPTTP